MNLATPSSSNAFISFDFLYYILRLVNLESLAYALHDEIRRTFFGLVVQKLRAFKDGDFPKISIFRGL